MRNDNQISIPNQSFCAIQLPQSNKIDNRHKNKTISFNYTQYNQQHKLTAKNILLIKKEYEYICIGQWWIKTWIKKTKTGIIKGLN